MNSVNPVKYYSTHLIDKDNMILIKDFVSWVINKFFTIKRQLKMNIDIKFDDKLKINKGLIGACIWEDTHYRPNEFTIEVDTSQTFKDMLNTIAHELAHVKQWAYGYFYEPVHENAKRKSKNKIYKFAGKKIDTAKIEYLDQPWEIEAMGLSITLVLQWCKARELDTADYVSIC
jgi:hypothetical protein